MSLRKTGLARDVTNLWRQFLRYNKTMPQIVVEIRASGESTLDLVFGDGTRGSVDLSQVLEFSGIFAPLQDPDFFSQAAVNEELGTVVWPNGADIAPETLVSVPGESERAA